mgnify:CR=1 FL=1|tara:strand:+ start:2694 stop:3299 length:606 start_codon:yes stop_codon:yes gene_type:complete
MVSDNTFSNRINYLVSQQGVKKQAQFYGVTTRTVRRWQAGETQPSRRTKESVRTRGLYAGAPQQSQVRRNGRFVQARRSSDTANFNAIVALNKSLRNRRNARIRDARARGNQRQLRDAQALPMRLNRREAQSITEERTRLDRGARITNLMTQGVSPDSIEGMRVMGDVPNDFENWENYYEYIDYDEGDWETWRSGYEQIAG